MLFVSAQKSHTKLTKFYGRGSALAESCVPLDAELQVPTIPRALLVVIPTADTPRDDRRLKIQATDTAARQVHSAYRR